MLTVSDADGHVVRRLKGPVSTGFHRVDWDLRFPPSTPVNLKPPAPDPFAEPPRGPMVLPGRYTVSMARVVAGTWTTLAPARPFEARGLFEIPAADRQALLAFERKVARLQRAVFGAAEAIDEGKNRIAHVRQALLDTPDADASLSTRVNGVEARLLELERAIKGDSVLARRNEATPFSISSRVDSIVDSQWSATSAPTATSRDAYTFAAEGFVKAQADLREVLGGDLKKIEEALEIAGAPWTPGRLPSWKPE